MSGVEKTHDRKSFLALMGQLGHASSAELVEAVLEDMGWGDRQAFTKADVVAVLEATMAAGKEMVKDAAGTTPEERERLTGLITAVQQNAVPLLKKDASGH